MFHLLLAVLLAQDSNGSKWDKDKFHAGSKASEHMEKGLLFWDFTVLGMLEALTDPAQDEIKECQFSSNLNHMWQDKRWSQLLF